MEVAALKTKFSRDPVLKVRPERDLQTNPMVALVERNQGLTIVVLSFPNKSKGIKFLKTEPSRNDGNNQQIVHCLMCLVQNYVKTRLSFAVLFGASE